MKRKLFLTVIPALMVLSSCAGVPHNNGLFVKEDTLAHEELFADAELKQPGIRQMDIVDSNSPLIGIQFSSPVNNKINIRFVAAIKVESEAALAHTTAVWTRTMYDGSGDVVTGKEAKEFVATKAYDKINGGGDNITAGVGDYAAYNYFVVYTIMNIPVSGDNDASNYYLNAYLTVDDAENNNFDAQSKLVSTTVNKAKQVAVDLNDAKQNGFFLKGKTSAGVDYVVEKDNPTKGEYPEYNHASFTFDINKDDNFVIVEKDASRFYVYDASCLRGDPSGFAFSNANNRIKANYNESVIIYLNKAGEIYTNITSNLYQLYINDVLSSIENVVPENWSDKAVFSGVVIDSANTSVKIKLNGNQVGSEYNFAYAGSYTIGLNSGDSIWADGDSVTISISVDCNSRGPVASWGGKVYIVGSFCNWDSTNPNAIELTDNGSNVWTGTTSGKYGSTFSYKVRLNAEAGGWDNSDDNWYPHYHDNDNTFVPSLGSTALNISWGA